MTQEDVFLVKIGNSLFGTFESKTFRDSDYHLSLLLHCLDDPIQHVCKCKFFA